MSSNEVAHREPVTVDTTTFELDQRRAKAYADSGYWPDAASIARALVKIEAGRALGLPPLIAMSEVHVIEGKPSLGAGALATLVKTSGRYDYHVVELTNEKCILDFFEDDERIGTSEFVLEDARTAGILGRGPWKQYPRNMLFARAMSNGVAWFCPDVTAGRMYVPDEIGELPSEQPEEIAGYETATAEEVPVVEHPPQPQPAAKASDAHSDAIRRLIEELRGYDPETDWVTWCLDLTGGVTELDEIGAEKLIARLMEKVHDLSPPSEEE